MNPSLAASLSSIGAGAGQLLFGGKNPASAASPYLNQVPGTITPYYQPYIDSGTNAMNTLNTQYNQNINNPAAVMNQVGAGYQQSPGYQWNVNQATNAANQASAAGGMAGSPQEQQQLATTVSGLANQDYYDYVDRAMKQYNTGLSGMSHINDMGYNASNELAQSLANNLLSQAKLQYAGQMNQNQSQGGGWGDLIGGVTSLLPTALSFL